MYSKSKIPGTTYGIVKLGEFLIRDLRRIVCDLDRFSMIGAASANLTVRRLFDLATDVSDFSLEQPLACKLLLEHVLGSLKMSDLVSVQSARKMAYPEATVGKDRHRLASTSGGSWDDTGRRSLAELSGDILEETGHREEQYNGEDELDKDANACDI